MCSIAARTRRVALLLGLMWCLVLTPSPYVQNIVAYPISQGRILNVAALVMNPELEGTLYEGPWTTDVSQEEVRREYVGWEPEVDDFVQVCLRPASPYPLVSLT